MPLNNAVFLDEIFHFDEHEFQRNVVLVQYNQRYIGIDKNHHFYNELVRNFE